MARSPRGQVRSARRPRTVLAILNGRGHKLARLVVSRGRADSWIESEQLFPLDAIFQFEHLNNREGEDILLPPPLPSLENLENRRGIVRAKTGRKRKRLRRGWSLAGKGKTEKIREDLSPDPISKSETTSLRPYFFPV